MNTYYDTSSNDNLDNFKDRIKRYEEQPDKKVWNGIEKHLSKRGFPFKALSLIGMSLIVLAVSYVFFTPSKKQTKEILSEQNNVITKIANNNVRALLDNAITFKEDIVRSATNNKITTIIRSNTTEIVTKDTISAQVAKQKTTVDVVKKENVMETPTDKVPAEETKKPEALPVSSNIGKIEPPSEDIPEAEELFIPNAFTPLEATNNIFKPKTEKQISDFEMKIFNRNGMQIFSCKNIDEGWNGNIKGVVAPQGVYVYIVTYKDSQNKKHTQKGNLMLLR